LRLASAALRSPGAWLSAARSTTARLGRSMAEAAADKVEWEWGRECRGVLSLGFGLACSAAAASRRLFFGRRDACVRRARTGGKKEKEGKGRDQTGVGGSLALGFVCLIRRLLQIKKSWQFEREREYYSAVLFFNRLRLMYEDPKTRHSLQPPFLAALSLSLPCSLGYHTVE
jgi:hypothetical protein